jgi:cholesterol oxidase
LCVLGCTHGAKTTLDLTYLLTATTAGACIRPLCEATRIEPCTKGFQVSGMDYRTGTPFVVRAERLVVAAGTLNTARLLFTARDRDRTLPAISPALGRNFSGNADYPMLVRRNPAPEPSSGALVNTAAHAGPIERYYVDADIPIPVASAALGRAVGRYRLMVGMGPDGSRASLTLRRSLIATDAGRHHVPTLYGQMDADAAAVRRNGRGAIRSVRQPPGKLVSAHPLGGATIAANAVDGVVDHAGRVFGYRRLYVADGSLLPTAPGVPPSLTIAALAERQAALMLQEG